MLSICNVDLSVVSSMLQVLNMVVLGSSSPLAARSSSPLTTTDLTNPASNSAHSATSATSITNSDLDSDLQGSRTERGSSQSVPSTPHNLPAQDLLGADHHYTARMAPPRRGSPRRQRNQSPARNGRENYTIKLTARTVSHASMKNKPQDINFVHYTVIDM